MKDVIKIEKEKIDLALYIIELKEADMIKNSNNKTYDKFKEEMDVLTKERKEIYRNNTKVINKVLTEYIKEVQI